MWRQFLAAVVLFQALASVESIIKLVETDTKCSIFDANDIESYNYDNCTTTRYTGSFFDLDGFMVFKGLSRLETASVCYH